jgi:predicted ester cyclase
MADGPLPVRMSAGFTLALRGGRRPVAVLRTICGPGGWNEEAVQLEAAENKAAMRRIMEHVINEKNLDAAFELFSDEHVLHPETPGIGRGGEGMKRAFAGLHEQFPDVRVTIESMVGEEDMVAVRLTFSGTDTATGERATWPEMVFTRFSAGRAVESWEIIDTGRGPGSPPW